MKLFFSVFLCFISTGHTTTPYAAKVFSLETPSKLLYSLKIEIKKNTRYMSWYTPNSNLVAKSFLTLKNGELIRYGYTRSAKGLTEISEVTNNNKKHIFKKNLNNEISTKQLTTKDTLLVGSQIISFIQTNWKSLNKGKTIDFKFGVLDLQKAINFKLYKEGENIIMKVSNIFYRVFVNTIVFKFNPEGTKVLSMKGRLLPVTSIDNKVKGVDGLVKFLYKAQ